MIDDDDNETRLVDLSPGAAQVLEALSLSTIEMAIKRAARLWIAVGDLARKFGQPETPRWVGGEMWPGSVRFCVVFTGEFMISCEVSWSRVYIIDILEQPTVMPQPNMWARSTPPRF